MRITLRLASNSVGFAPPPAGRDVLSGLKSRVFLCRLRPVKTSSCLRQCRYRLGVRTRGSQPRDRGSNPRTGTTSSEESKAESHRLCVVCEILIPLEADVDRLIDALDKERRRTKHSVLRVVGTTLWRRSRSLHVSSKHLAAPIHRALWSRRRLSLTAVSVQVSCGSLACCSVTVARAVSTLCSRVAQHCRPCWDLFRQRS